MRSTTILVSIVCMALSCRSTKIAPGAVEQPVAGGVLGAISTGDDVCAVMLRFDLTAVDPEGRSVPEAELWEIDRHHIKGKAWRLGATDANGHLDALSCYMGSLEFRFWHPADEPVQLHLMVLREGYGIRHLRFTPSSQEVLEAGNLLGVPPGQSFDWSKVERGPELRDRAFRITTTVILVPAGI